MSRVYTPHNIGHFGGGVLEGWKAELAFGV